jgi:hypothetical protein
LGQKCNLNDIFHEGKEHFAMGKRHPLAPPVPTPLPMCAHAVRCFPDLFIESVKFEAAFSIVTPSLYQ